MTKVWLIIVSLFVANVALKAVGPLSLGRHEPSSGRAAVTSLLAPALLAGLVVYETFGSAHGPGLTLDARVGGLVVAAGALALRLPLLAVVVAAALATALLRALA